MTIETATYISQLDATYPAAGDAKSEGDNHLRLIKSAVKATLPNVTATPLTPTSADFNTLTGAATTGGGGLNVVTQSSSNNSTLAASTAMVQNAIAAAVISVTLPSAPGAGREMVSDASSAAGWGMSPASIYFCMQNFGVL